MEPKAENRFFSEHLPTDPLVIAVLNFMRRKNREMQFMEKTMGRIGYPRWDKAMVVTKTNTTAGRGNSGDSTEIVYVPFVRDNQHYVNASLIIAINPADTSFSYLCDWQYQNKVYGSASTVTSAENQAILFMYLDNTVFGNRTFRIHDAQLFQSQYLVKDTALRKIKITDSAITQGRLNNIPQLVCFEFVKCPSQFCWDQGYCDYPNCPTGVCTYQYDFILVFDNGGGSGSGGNGNGGNGGGGSAGGGTPPDCDSTAERAFNVNPCEPGWEPIEDEPENPPLQDTLLNPCAHANVVAADQQFRNMLIDLKSHSDNPNDTSEHAWVYVDSPTGYSFDSLSGNPGVKGINFDISIPLDGMAHNHFVNSLSVFSPDDIWSICTLFKDKLMVDSSKFTFPLVTAEGTQYMLMIENITKFRNWANVHLAGSLGIYKYLYRAKFKISEENTNEMNEKNFLQYLNKTNGGSGLKLFRGNSSFTAWTPLGLDWNENVIVKPCN